MTYQILNENTVLDYVRNQPDASKQFSDMESVAAREVGDGNLNLVFILQSTQNPTEAVVVKQAVPYLRVVGESWPLSRERMRFEAQALLLYGELVPAYAPAVHHYDEAMSVVVMEYLATLQVMRKPLVARQQFPRFADHISTFLAHVLFKTSDLYLTGLDKKTLQGKFINPHLCKIQEDFVFTNPYMESPENVWNPEIDAQVQAVRANTTLKMAIAELKEKFMTQGQALIHSDLHTGSIMVNTNDTRVIDPEFGFFGPMGYDVGAVLSNLMMNYASHYAHTPDTDVRRAYQAYLMDTMRAIWTGFAEKFEQLWIAHNTGELVPDAYWRFPDGEAAFAAYRQRTMRQLLQDTFGLGSCESLRRMMGLVSVWDITSIEDNRARAVAEDLIIRVSSRWILERSTFHHIDDALGIFQEEAAYTENQVNAS